MARNMDKVILNNGVEMPGLGFGVFQIFDPKQCEQCVIDALHIGYRLIDTAAAYANEEAVGKAIKNSGVPREEVFITTKLWTQDCYSKEATKAAFEKSLKKMQLDYIDLYMIHQPFGDVYTAWRAMTELYKEGKVRAIGVCNFQPDRLVDFIFNNEITPAVNQIEIQPFFQRDTDLRIMKEYDIQPEAWGPFAEGRNGIFQNETLRGIGLEYGKSIAQVILRWQYQRGVVAIPKSVNPSRIKENYNIFDFELSEDDMNIIAGLDTHKSAFFPQNDPDVVKGLLAYELDEEKGLRENPAKIAFPR